MKGIFVLLVIGFVSMAFLNTQKTQRIATGIWGGPHISLNVGARSATVEYDCATGTIEGPLVVHSDGKFELRGTLTPERGGPIRADDVPKSQPATYTGVIRGNTMTLTLNVAGDDESVETFTLEKGKAGELFKCK